MTSRFIDKYDRVDGVIGDDYLVPCGGVQIDDEAVIPIDAAQVASGVSPLFTAGTTAQKTQVFLNSKTMDGPNYVVRCTWAHDEIDDSSDANLPPSITLLARMSKDPLLHDLGVAEEPLCYDQGYGARVTMPLNGTAPTLKIVKYQPRKRVPNLTKPSSIEVDGAVVLEEIQLDFDDLNLDASFDPATYVAGTTALPYKGFWQDMRLRIRRADNEVILDVYLNDRNLNTSKLTFIDRRDPLWGVTGLPGYEFLSATLTAQSAGVSAFSLAGLSSLRVGIFSAETFLDVRQPVHVSPGAFFTYREVTNRVILLVEKQGDAKYNATTAGQTKFDTYLQFVLEAEADIIRREGYYRWLKREQRVYLKNQVADYELPEDMGLLDMVRPGNWNNVPLRELSNMEFRQRLAGVQQSGGRPTVYVRKEQGPNNRPQITLFPVPLASAITVIDQSGRPTGFEDPYLAVEYFARQLRPSDPDVQIPFIPQAHMDVLIYGAAAHALILDTDPNNMQAMTAVYVGKLKGLVRANNRKVGSGTTRFIQAGDFFQGSTTSRIPLLRSTQLESLLAF